jgi:prepilin-type processing-associated H-X9-DG protein
MSNLIRKTGLTREAFTVLELVTVATTLTVLTAVALPSFGFLRRRAEQTASFENLAQWGAALSLSLEDHDGRLPSVTERVEPGNPSAWYNRLPPYIGERPYSKLDSTELLTARPRSIWIDPAVASARGGSVPADVFSYGMNSCLSTAAEPRLAFRRIERPAATVFLSEKDDLSPSCRPSQIKAYFGAGNIDRDLRNGANFLFCDSHVEFALRSKFESALHGAARAASTVAPVTFLPFREALAQ